MRDDYQILVELATALKGQYINPESRRLWDSGPFGWIKQDISSRQIGAIGERLVAGWAEARGLTVSTAPDGQADRVINGKRVEIKFSTLWKAGVYTFQQFRDQNYDYVVCLGLSPRAAHCWVIPKPFLVAHRFDLPGLSGQHTGKRASDTRWLSFDVSRPPEWLSQFGGLLDEAMRLLKSI